MHNLIQLSDQYWLQSIFIWLISYVVAVLLVIATAFLLDKEKTVMALVVSLMSAITSFIYKIFKYVAIIMIILNLFA